MTADPLQILQLPPTATQDEIKTAYRRLVALYHPDNNPGFPDEATAKVRELNDAYAKARAGWKPPVGTVPGTYSPRPPHENPPRVWDPPQPPKKPVGPQVPPAKYADVPPPRSGPPTEPTDAVAAQLLARRAALVDDLVAARFFGSPDDAALDHAVVDAFLPLYPAGARLRLCSRYTEVASRGEAPEPRHRHEFLHAVPSLAAGGAQGRQDAIDRIVRAQFIACTDDLLMWTVSSDGEGEGILHREDIDVFAADLASVVEVARTDGDLQFTLAQGLGLAFRLDAVGAEQFEQALTRA